MILNTASNIIFNGSAAKAVIYNGQKIWPTATAYPSGAWSASGQLNFDASHTAAAAVPMFKRLSFNWLDGRTKGSYDYSAVMNNANTYGYSAIGADDADMYQSAYFVKTGITFGQSQPGLLPHMLAFDRPYSSFSLGFSATANPGDNIYRMYLMCTPPIFSGGVNVRSARYINGSELPSGPGVSQTSASAYHKGSFIFSVQYDADVTTLIYPRSASAGTVYNLPFHQFWGIAPGNNGALIWSASSII